MNEQPNTSVDKAIQRGLVMVYGPFLPLVFGIPALVLSIATPLHLPGIVSLLSVPTGILAAWLWWSYCVPLWRVWALQHVDDIEMLHQRAVQIGIEWPYGHFFERTEIKSHQQMLQEVSLQLRRYLQRTQMLLAADANSDRFSSLSHEIQDVIAQLSLDQRIAEHQLNSLEQSLIQLVVQPIAQATNVSPATTFATSAYFIDKYRHVYTT